MDIFDKIMLWPFLRRFNPFYRKHKELLLYIIFGGLTTVISIAVFGVFSYIICLNEVTANTISWICAVSFSYVTNRVWVFGNVANGIIAVIREAISFFSARLITLFFENLLLFLFVTCLYQNKMIIKIIANIFVMIMNYIISKLFVFRKPKRNSSV